MNPVAYKGNGILQIMSQPEFDNLAANVLEYMASIDNGVGVITSNVTIAANANLTLIGTFEDIILENDVGVPGANIISQTFALYQELSSAAIPESNPPSIIGYDSSESIDALKVLSAGEYETLAANILSYCVINDGPFSYVLANTAPVSGTWEIKGALTELANSTLTGNVVFLYQKIADDAYTYNKPLKGIGSILQKFTDQEVQNIAKKVRERILATNIGEYRFQEGVPSVGTWVAKGSIVDIKFTTTGGAFEGATFLGPGFDGISFQDSYSGEVNYTGNYEGPYEGPGPSAVYSNSFISPSTPVNYVAPSVLYAGYIAAVPPYQGLLAGTPYSSNYVGAGPGFDLGQYLGIYTESETFVANYVATFAAEYTATFGSVVVGSTTEIVKTYNLWRRIG